MCLAGAHVGYLTRDDGQWPHSQALFVAAGFSRDLLGHLAVNVVWPPCRLAEPAWRWRYGMAYSHRRVHSKVAYSTRPRPVFVFAPGSALVCLGVVGGCSVA